MLKLKIKSNRGFTLVELLIVIAIIAILANIILVSATSAREEAYYGRAKLEFRHMAEALELYATDNSGKYPADVSRDLPPGLGKYLAGNDASAWPKAPWPGSVYDWENWDNPDPGHAGEKIYQISIRFCPVGGTLAQCNFPKKSWATNFDVDSSVYYCLSGSCRSHVNHPVTFPGYCVNCDVQPSGP